MTSREPAVPGAVRPLLSIVVADRGNEVGPELAAELDRVRVGSLRVAPGAEAYARALASRLGGRPEPRPLRDGDGLPEAGPALAGGPAHSVLVCDGRLAARLIAPALEGIDAGFETAPGRFSTLTRRGDGALQAFCLGVDPRDPLARDRGIGPRGATRRLYLVRHGECAIPTPDGRLHSHCDFPLTRRGRDQVERLGAAFAGIEDAAFLASPIKRSLESATGLAGGRPVTVVDGLAEISLGDFEGATIDAVYAAQPDFLHRAAAGLPGGETPEQVGERAFAALGRALAARPEKIVVAVAHGGTNRAVIGRLLGPTVDAALHLRQDWAGVSRFELSPSGWRLETLNWTPSGLAEPSHADAAWHGATGADPESAPSPAQVD